MLGNSPLRVLASKTAIMPVNQELMPRSADEVERCSRTVYAANIDKKVDKNDVRAFFESLCGEGRRQGGVGLLRGHSPAHASVLWQLWFNAHAFVRAGSFDAYRTHVLPGVLPALRPACLSPRLERTAPLAPRDHVLCHLCCAVLPQARCRASGCWATTRTRRASRSWSSTTRRGRWRHSTAAARCWVGHGGKHGVGVRPGMSGHMIELEGSRNCSVLLNNRLSTGVSA